MSSPTLSYNKYSISVEISSHPKKNNNYTLPKDKTAFLTVKPFLIPKNHTQSIRVYCTPMK